MEIAEASINELKIHDLPFGYKVNLWGNEEPLPIRKINIAKFNENAVNLNTIMGKREIDDDIYKNLGQKFIDNGAMPPVYCTFYLFYDYAFYFFHFS